MQIKKALAHLQQEEPLLVNNFTFEPDSVEHAVLETGESIYWVRNDSGRWLSVDVGSDEIMLFEEIGDDLEPDDGMVMYQNKDYEFSYEGTGRFLDEDDVELEIVTFKDYERDDEILRIIESDVTGDRTVSIGMHIADDEISLP